MGWADDEGGGDAKAGAKDEPRRRPRRASDEPAESKDAGPRRPQKSENAWGSSSTGKSSTRRDDDSDGEPRRRKRLADSDNEGETEITMIIPDLDEQARSRRPVVLWWFHFLGWTRVHLTSMSVVSFSSLRPFLTEMLRAGRGGHHAAGRGGS